MSTPPDFASQVTRDHLAASADALTELCRLASAASAGAAEPIRVRVGHYDHGAFLTLALSGFALLDATAEGRLVPVGEDAGEVTYAVVVNRSVDDQIAQTLTFLASLVARQSATRALGAGAGDVADVDTLVKDSDEKVATALAQQLHVDHWRKVALSLGERAQAIGLGLQVRFASPLLDADAVRRRAPVLRHVYNSLEPVRNAVDRVASAVSSALTVQGPNVPFDVLKRVTDLLEIGQVRRYVAHSIRDAFVCGNGYVAFSQPQPGLRLLPPDSVDIIGAEQFALIAADQRSREPLTEPVLHIPGAHQVDSSLGLSLLEPFVILLGQQEIVDRAVNDAERFPQSDARDAWLSRIRALAQRAADDRTRRIETLLGGATRPFSEPPTDLYFPGFELMAPAVDQLSFSDGMNLSK